MRVNQARSDAMADADTLLSYAATWPRDTAAQAGISGDKSGGARNPLARIDDAAYALAFSEWFPGQVDAASVAVASAHAAFRAVPGLRGEPGA